MQPGYEVRWIQTVAINLGKVLGFNRPPSRTKKRIHKHAILHAQLAIGDMQCSTPPPPPLSFPNPCLPPGGGDGGPSLGQPKFFRCASFFCCVGDCVVGHCHLYPLHSWEDILLTFAKMELDNTTMFPP